VHGRESNSQPVVDEEEEKDERKKKGKVKENKTFLDPLSYTIIGGWSINKQQTTFVSGPLVTPSINFPNGRLPIGHVRAHVGVQYVINALWVMVTNAVVF